MPPRKKKNNSESDLTEDVNRGENTIDNQVKIANRGIEVYTQTIIDKLQNHDQVEICVQDNYLDKAMKIIRQFEALGIIPEKKYLNELGLIRFQKREEDIEIRGTNKKIRRPVNRVTLTKHPELFRFTKL